MKLLFPFVLFIFLPFSLIYYTHIMDILGFKSKSFLFVLTLVHVWQLHCIVTKLSSVHEKFCGAATVITVRFICHFSSICILS